MTESHPAGKTESRVRLVEMGECETMKVRATGRQMAA